MSIVTKTGDKGSTSLMAGERVSKSDVRVEAFGSVDELNSAIGICYSYVKDKKITEILGKVQNHLFIIGAEISALSKEKKAKVPVLMEKHLEILDQEIKRVEPSLPEQKAFILPRGGESASHLHLARTICRRAERRVVECADYNVNPII